MFEFVLLVIYSQFKRTDLNNKALLLNFLNFTSRIEQENLRTYLNVRYWLLLEPGIYGEELFQRRTRDWLSSLEKKWGSNQTSLCTAPWSKTFGEWRETRWILALQLYSIILRLSMTVHLTRSKFTESWAHKKTTKAWVKVCVIVMVEKLSTYLLAYSQIIVLKNNSPFRGIYLWNIALIAGYNFTFYTGDLVALLRVGSRVAFSLYKTIYSLALLRLLAKWLFQLFFKKLNRSILPN